MNLDIRNRLFTTPQWMLILGAACTMFFGQVLWSVLASVVSGPLSPEADPSPQWTQLPEIALGVVVLPYLETLIGQWLPIYLVRRFITSSWWVAGLVSAIWFTVLHAYTDRMAVNMLIGAVVLAAVFILEKQRKGSPIVSTYLTHALSNAMVFGLQFLLR